MDIFFNRKQDHFTCASPLHRNFFPSLVSSTLLYPESVLSHGSNHVILPKSLLWIPITLNSFQTFNFSLQNPLMEGNLYRFYLYLFMSIYINLYLSIFLKTDFL